MWEERLHKLWEVLKRDLTNPHVRDEFLRVLSRIPTSDGYLQKGDWIEWWSLDADPGSASPNVENLLDDPSAEGFLVRHVAQALKITSTRVTWIKVPQGPGEIRYPQNNGWGHGSIGRYPSHSRIVAVPVVDIAGWDSENWGSLTTTVGVGCLKGFKGINKIRKIEPPMCVTLRCGERATCQGKDDSGNTFFSCEKHKLPLDKGEGIAEKLWGE